MAQWSRNKINSNELNGGNELDNSSNFTLDELNAVVNGGLYSQDFVEHLADTPDVSEVGNVGTPSVEIVDNVVNGKTYKKFKFKNLRGAQGAQGYTPLIGDNGNWQINGEDTEKPSRGEQGYTPIIGDNGNWYINGEDTGKPSRGETGPETQNATNLMPDENGAVNPGGRGEGTVGANSTALGNRTTAGGKGSTALGYSASADGINSTALGYDASAGGNSSTALGYIASADVAASTALGWGASARGEYSTALGASATTSETDSYTIKLGSPFLSSLRCKVNLTVTSDKRDKTDINNITNALQFIDKLNPVTFVSNDRENYISEADKKSENYRKYGMCNYDRVSHALGAKKGERRRCGLLAQEVIAAMQTVYGTDNYANIVNDNFHDLQEKPSDVENKYTLTYANLVPFLIGAIKELNAEIKVLKDKLQ